MVKVLIVDDSPVSLQHMENILGQDPEITVIGTAQSGEEAIMAVRDKKPDIVTMDISMPRLQGFEATRIIMENTPVPIIFGTNSENIKEVVTSFTALEVGAVTLMARLPEVYNPEFETSSKTLREELKALAEIQLGRGYPKIIKPSIALDPFSEIVEIEIRKECAQIVAIGASTGGPVVLQTLLSGFCNKLYLPVVIVQHIAPGFTPGLSEWLAETTGFPIHIASPGDTLLPGHAYIAPDGFQMEVTIHKQISLIKVTRKNDAAQSVAYLFRSVRKAYGSRAIAILLTGMGRDGADELKILKDNGAITIAQDKKSSVVFGMPGEAIKINGATYVLSPDKIVETIHKIMHSGGNIHDTIS